VNLFLNLLFYKNNCIFRCGGAAVLMRRGPRC